MKSRHGITGCLKVTPELPANRTELGFWPTVSGQQVKIRVGDGLPTNQAQLDSWTLGRLVSNCAPAGFYPDDRCPNKMLIEVRNPPS
jgi:hypothetical protein